MLVASAALLCCAVTADATDLVYKCTTAGGIVYQGTPCDRMSATLPQAQAMALPASATALASLRAGDDRGRAQPAACTARAGTSSGGLWRRGALCLGITDDEVLNLPAWGKPVAIERVRVREGWREAWRYASAGGRQTRLSFLNGRLEDIGVDM